MISEDHIGYVNVKYFASSEAQPQKILESLPGKAKPFRNVLRLSRKPLEMDSQRFHERIDALRDVKRAN
jgi:hypothetical protein